MESKLHNVPRGLVQAGATGRSLYELWGTACCGLKGWQAHVKFDEEQGVHEVGLARHEAEHCTVGRIQGAVPQQGAGWVDGKRRIDAGAGGGCYKKCIGATLVPKLVE